MLKKSTISPHFHHRVCAGCLVQQWNHRLYRKANGCILMPGLGKAFHSADTWQEHYKGPDNEATVGTFKCLWLAILPLLKASSSHSTDLLQELIAQIHKKIIPTQNQSDTLVLQHSRGKRTVEFIRCIKILLLYISQISHICLQC